MGAPDMMEWVSLTGAVPAVLRVVLGIRSASKRLSGGRNDMFGFINGPEAFFKLL